MIDFSMPEGTMNVLQTCIERKIPLVVATTGHSEAQKRDIEGAAHHTAILMAPNMSLVVNVLFKLVRRAAIALKDKGFDIEIIERHHRFKKDSPQRHRPALRQDHPGSDGRDEDHAMAARGWSANGRRARSACTRCASGDNVGEHTIIFSTLGETMELVHKGHTRDAYVRGALQAAKFLATKAAGRYTMNDVLGL